MSLDETLQRLQATAWDHAASLPDAGALGNEHLSGWIEVAQAARPLLADLERPEVMQSLNQAVAAIPARPAQRATADSTLHQLATAMRDLHTQLPQDDASRQNAGDVVAVVIQSTARVSASRAHASSNPQVRAVARELDLTASRAHSAVNDSHAQTVTLLGSSRETPTATAKTAATTQQRHLHGPTPSTSPQAPSRRM